MELLSIQRDETARTVRGSAVKTAPDGLEVAGDLDALDWESSSILNEALRSIAASVIGASNGTVKQECVLTVAGDKVAGRVAINAANASEETLSLLHNQVLAFRDLVLAWDMFNHPQTGQTLANDDVRAEAEKFLRQHQGRRIRALLLVQVAGGNPPIEFSGRWASTETQPDDDKEELVGTFDGVCLSQRVMYLIRNGTTGRAQISYDDSSFRESIVQFFTEVKTGSAPRLRVLVKVQRSGDKAKHILLETPTKVPADLQDVDDHPKPTDAAAVDVF